MKGLDFLTLEVPAIPPDAVEMLLPHDWLTPQPTSSKATQAYGHTACGTVNLASMELHPILS